MENRILKGPGGVLLRVDVVSLQSALLKCKGVAKNALEVIAGGASVPPEISAALNEIMEISHDGVFAAKEYAEDFEVQYLIDKEDDSDYSPNLNPGLHRIKTHRL